MDVIKLVTFALQQQGFDGLYSATGECACEIGDLEPCNQISGDCQAGYRYICNDADCEFTMDAGEHWHMRKEK